MIGKVFGPIMILWFGSIGTLGLLSIMRTPEILYALNPWYAINFFSIHHLHGIVSLASVVLCITGCEALYADMGHFGRLPIRLTWYGVVLPGLVLNYYGQGALLLHDPGVASVNPFYALAPKASALSPGRAGHAFGDHCLPGDDLGGLFADPAGHSTRVSPRACGSSTPREAPRARFICRR